MKKYYFVAVPQDKPNQFLLEGLTKEQALEAIPQIKSQLPNLKVVTWTFITGEEDEQGPSSQSEL